MPSRRVAVLAALTGLAGIAGAAVAARALAGGSGNARASLARSSMPSVRTYDFGARLMRPFYERIADAVVSGSPPGASVLDVGCGPGHLDILIAVRDPSLLVTGVDVDPGMVERATAHATRAFAVTDPARPNFAVGDASALPFRDGTFDLAVSTFSFHHWENPAAGLAELHRVLRPGSRALIWDLAGPLRHHSVSGRGVMDLAPASPFGRASRARQFKLGPIVLGERYELERGLAGPAGGEGEGATVAPATVAPAEATIPGAPDD